MTTTNEWFNYSITKQRLSSVSASNDCFRFCVMVFNPEGCWTVSMTWTKWLARDTREPVVCPVTCCSRLYTWSSHTLWVKTAFILWHTHGGRPANTWLTICWPVSVFRLRHQQSHFAGTVFSSRRHALSPWFHTAFICEALRLLLWVCRHGLNRTDSVVWLMLLKSVTWFKLGDCCYMQNTAHTS